MSNKTLETLIVISVLMALIVMIVGSTVYTFSMTSMILFAFSGVLMGVFAAPLIEPQAFRMPTLFQAVVGALTGVTLASAFNLPIAGLLAGAALGAVPALFARRWTRRLPLEMDEMKN